MALSKKIGGITMKIFISHSTKDWDIVARLSSFLESLSDNIEVFCSSDSGAIPTGNDFIQTITTELETCDAFLPLISDHYFKSKFCMIELGFAYSQLHKLDNEERQRYIYPFCIPPLGSNALQGTPLGNIEAAQIDSVEGFRSILENTQDFQSGRNRRIHSFVESIRSLLLARKDFFADASIDVFCSDNVDFKDKYDYVSFSRMESETTFNFNLDPYECGGARPNFVSLVYGFIDQIDLAQVLAVNENSSVDFEIRSFTNSLSKIDVEFKFSDNNRILKVLHLPIHYGRNSFSVPLAEMRSNALKQVSEICFVIHPGDTVENEGMIKISNLRTSMG